MHGLEFPHLFHGLTASKGQREEKDVDQDAKQDDAQAPILDYRKEEVEEIDNDNRDAVKESKVPNILNAIGF